LTVDASVPERARTALIVEATRIWRRHGLELSWPRDGATPALTGVPLRALVTRGPTGPVRDNVYAVGRLLRPLHAAPLALISLDRARAIVAQTRHGATPFATILDQHVLGVVLGRALAHEIGHYVLDTATHSLTGLMRARFDPAEFADARDGVFVLDRGAAALLAERTQAGRLPWPALPSAAVVEPEHSLSHHRE
jgi:hypothetical protein